MVKMTIGWLHFKFWCHHPCLNLLSQRDARDVVDLSYFFAREGGVDSWWLVLQDWLVTRPSHGWSKSRCNWCIPERAKSTVLGWHQPPPKLCSRLSSFANINIIFYCFHLPKLLGGAHLLHEKIIGLSMPEPTSASFQQELVPTLQTSNPQQIFLTLGCSWLIFAAEAVGTWGVNFPQPWLLLGLYRWLLGARFSLDVYHNW